MEPPELVPDNWRFILDYACRLPSTAENKHNHVKSWSEVCKDWRGWTMDIVVRQFTLLQKRAMAVDEACKMRYPLQLLALHEEMRVFCANLGMEPWQVLCYVQPAWGILQIEDKHDFNALHRMRHLDEWNRTRYRPWYMTSTYPTCSEIYLLGGAWLMGWTPYLLALFLTCHLGLLGFKRCAFLAAQHCIATWKVSVYEMKYLEQYYSSVEAFTQTYQYLDMVDKNYSNSVPITGFGNMLHSRCKGLSGLYIFYPSLQSYAEERHQLSALVNIPGRLTRDDAWKQLFPDPRTVPREAAQELYRFIRGKLAPKFPYLWNDELRLLFRECIV